MRPKGALECGGLTPPFQRKGMAPLCEKGGVKPPHSKGFASNYAALIEMQS
jgi:hypothetical protein